MRTILKANHMLLVFFALVAFGQCGKIVDLAANDPDLSTFARVLQLAGLTDILNNTGSFTVLAPTNGAIAALGADAIDQLTKPANQLALMSLLARHIASGATLMSAGLKDHQILTTGNILGMRPTSVQAFLPPPSSLTSPQLVFFNGAQVVAADLQASNGVLHKIDAVLTDGNAMVPLTVAQQMKRLLSMQTFVSTLQSVGLFDKLDGAGPFVVLAPTNAAFRLLPAGTIDTLASMALLTTLLQFHVITQIVFPQDRLNIVTVAGENATIYFTGDRLLYAVNYARVVSFDPIRCSNGLIFIIDNVLMPAALMVNKALPVPAPPASPPTQSLGIMLASDSRFSTLVSLLAKANLFATLNSNSSTFTLLAPTNEAFARLPKEVRNYLTTDPVGAMELADILTTHVISGSAAVLSSDLRDRRSIATLSGSVVTAYIQYGTNAVFFNFARVLQADLVCANGVAHVLDMVLMPPSVFTKQPPMDMLARTVYASTSMDRKQFIGQNFNGSIVDFIASTPDLSALAIAVVDSNLTSTLSGTGPFTLFAPSNAAIARLPTTLTLSLSQRMSPLPYHIINHRITSVNLAAFMFGSSWQTLHGASVTITTGPAANITVDAALVSFTIRDIECDNGVVHVIDRVLLPPTMATLEMRVKSDADLSSLATIVSMSDIGAASTLSRFTSYLTLFAPTDVGVNDLQPSWLQRLLLPANGDMLNEFLLYHSTLGQVKSTDLVDRASVVTNAVSTINSDNVTVFVPPGFQQPVVFINNARVVQADISASNGVIHQLDRVLVPPNVPRPMMNVLEQLRAIPRLSMFAQILAWAFIDNSLLIPNVFYTIFAPTNEAFAELPVDILSILQSPVQALTMGAIFGNYILPTHVQLPSAVSPKVQPGYVDRQLLSNSKGEPVWTLYAEENDVFVNYAHVEFDNLPASATNGAIYVLSKIILPPNVIPVPLALAAAVSKQQTQKVMVDPPTMNLVQLVQTVPQLSTLVSLVIKAGLDTALAGPGPFTVIAPTNEAFARLSAQTLNFLTSDAGKDSLTAILKYHAVSGAQVNSNQLVDGQQIQTLQGENLNAYVPANLSSVYFNYAKVVTADVLATNGVAHVIDHVVFPHAYFVQPTAPPLPPLSSSSLSSSSLSAVHQQVMTSSSVQLQERLSSARTIADYLTANSDKFSSLVGALSQANLIDALNSTSSGSLTMFAPDNDAFDLLDMTAVQGLTNQQLTNVLTYHVLPVAATTFQMASRLVQYQTLFGPTLTPFIPDFGHISVDYANIREVGRDIRCSNGIIHVIDRPLVPSSALVVPSTSTTPTPSPAVADGNKLNLALIIGASVGGAALLGLACFAYFRCAKKRQSDELEAESSDGRYKPLSD